MPEPPGDLPVAWEEPEPEDVGQLRKARTWKSLTAQGVRKSVSDRLLQHEMQRETTRKIQRANRWVINPLDGWVRKWDFVMMLALCFVAVVTPVEVAMLDVKLDGLFCFNRGVDLLFLLDMVLQLFLMYEVKTRFGVILETRHSAIIRHYLRGWFIIDIISIIPFDVLGLGKETGGADGLEKAKLLKIIRQFRLFKLLRAVKASRFFARLEENLSIAYHTLHLIKCMVILVVSCHWTACAWALTLNLVSEKETGQTHRWVDAVTVLEDNVEIKTKDDPMKLYLAAAYFASYTMTSVGYGDISPRNDTERFVLLVLLFCSGLLWTYLLGEVCNVVSAMGSQESNFRSTMDDLNFMMNDRALPKPMCKKLRRFFLSTRDVRSNDRNNMLFTKLSPALRGEVAWATNHMWITKVSFLTGMIRESAQGTERRKTLYGGVQEVTPTLPTFEAFVVDIAVSLQTRYFAGEELFGDSHTLYILNRGLVGRMMRVLRSGAVWGEDFVLRDHSLQEPVSSHALTYVEVLNLSRPAFLEIVERHSQKIPGLKKQIRRFCVRLAAHRGILAEARKRAEKQARQPDPALKKSAKNSFAKLRTAVWAARVAAPPGIKHKDAATVLRDLRKSVQDLKTQQSETDELLKQLLELHRLPAPDGARPMKSTLK